MNAVATSNVQVIPLQSIALDFSNTRRKISADDVATLEASIRNVGLLQPLVVTQSGEGRFTLIAGFTRFEAIKALGWTEVAVTVISGTDSQILESHIAENATRFDLSLVSSVDAVKRLATQVGGDYEEVGARLGLTPKQLNDRLALAACSASVLTALDDEKIKLGHAIVLSAFSHKLQDTTLEKIIDESWTVEYTKERAGKAKIRLTLAKFDLAECHACPHNSNSNSQGSLFGEEIEKDICSNTTCFAEKQEKWLTAQKYAMREEYGTLLDRTMVDSKQIRLIDVTYLGDTQVSACASCANNVAVIENNLKSPNIGQVRTGICNNLPCFEKCVAAHQATQAPVVDDTAAVKDKTDSNTTSATPKAKTEPTPLGGSLVGSGQRISANHLLAEDVIATYGSDLDKARMRYIAAVQLTQRHLREDVFSSIQHKSIEELTVEMDAMLQAFLANCAKTEVDNKPCSTSNTGMFVAHGLARINDDPKAVVVRSWKPSALHRGYPKAHIIAILQESGFFAAYEAEHGESDAKKLEAMKKPDLLKAIDESAFDWSHYAPAGYINRFIPNSTEA